MEFDSISDHIAVQLSGGSSTTDDHTGRVLDAASPCAAQLFVVRIKGVSQLLAFLKVWETAWRAGPSPHTTYDRSLPPTI